MTIQHSLITDPDIHEPKGVAAAAAGKVYVSNGTGGGSWQFPPASLYGEIYIDAGVTAQTLSAASAYAKLNPTAEWTAGITSGLATDATNGYITLSQAGKYLVTFWVSFDTAAIAAGSKYNFRFALNDTSTGRILTVDKKTAGAERLSVSFTSFISATAGQSLSVRTAGDGTSSSTDITVVESGLTAVRLSE
jgi:hypothetical protein